MKKLMCLSILCLSIANFLPAQANAAEPNSKYVDTNEENLTEQDISIEAESDNDDAANKEEYTKDEELAKEETEKSENELETNEIIDSPSEQLDSTTGDADSDNESKTEDSSDISDELKGKIKITDLKWNSDSPGEFSFRVDVEGNANDLDMTVYIYKDGIRQYSYMQTGFGFNKICVGNNSYGIEESGDYTFKVHVVSNQDDFFNENKGVLSESSDVFHYVRPEKKIDAPKVEWVTSRPGVIRYYKVPNAKYYYYGISCDDWHSVFTSSSTSTIPDGEFVEYDWSHSLKPNTTYQLRAKAYSGNINEYAHSDYSEPVEFYFTGSNDNNDSQNNNDDRSETASDSTNNNDEGKKIISYAWIPTTPEEKVRYACMGKEKVQYIVDQNQPFNINIQNVMQGEKCFEVFKNFANDYTIARTYNIHPDNKDVKYSTNEKITFSLVIPDALQKENREFKMICVSENGMPYIFDDNDINPNTITIDTDKFYAYALIYKDN